MNYRQAIRQELANNTTANRTPSIPLRRSTSTRSRAQAKRYSYTSSRSTHSWDEARDAHGQQPTDQNSFWSTVDQDDDIDMASCMFF